MNQASVLENHKAQMDRLVRRVMITAFVFFLGLSIFRGDPLEARIVFIGAIVISAALSPLKNLLGGTVMR